MTLKKLYEELRRVQALKAIHGPRSRRGIELHAEHVKLKVKQVQMEARAAKAARRAA